jgi:hypothetical protein
MFWLATAVAAFIMTAIVYAPMFTGKIPFPSIHVFGFPPFAQLKPGYVSTIHTNIGDLITSFYPYRTLAARAVRAGRLPLWNPYMLSGSPFLANSQSALFYPPNFAYYILPVPLAWALGFIVRRALSVMFTALFLRRIGATTAGAVAGGLVFAYCGFLNAWQGQSMSDAATWLPLICYAVVRLYDEPKPIPIAIAAIAFAMPVLAGHPETAAHLALTGIALAAFIWLRKPDAMFVRAFIISGALALGLAAVQAIPTVEWIGLINHSLKIQWPPLPVRSALGLVSRDIRRDPNSIGLMIPEEAAYVAMMCFTVAPLSLLRRRSRAMALFFAVWGIAALAVVYGIGPAAGIVQHIPLIGTLKNNRLILVASFGAAVLTGIGISELEEWQAASPSRTWIAAILATAGSITALILVYLVHRIPTSIVIEFARQPRFNVFLIISAMLVVFLRLARRVSARSFAGLALAIIVLDLATLSYKTIPFTKPRDVFPPVELFDRLQKSGPPARIIQIGPAYGANFELVYGHASTGGYELPLRRLRDLLNDVTYDEMDTVTPTVQGVLDTRDRRFDMLNTKYYIVSEWDPHYKIFRQQSDRFRYLFTYADTDVFENLRSMPPAYLVPQYRAEVITDDDRQLARVKDPEFNAEQSVILSERPQTSEYSSQVPVVTTPRVEWKNWHVNGFDLEVNANGPSVLVVSQMYYPGWKAYIDDEPVPITRANYAFPAILVSTGSHHVRFSFEPWTFKLGLALTALAVIILCTMVFGGTDRPAQNHI